MGRDRVPARHLPVAPVVLAPNVDHADHANRVALVVPVVICVAAALAAALADPAVDGVDVAVATGILPRCRR
jgi:hypothetical protein